MPTLNETLTFLEWKDTQSSATLAALQHLDDAQLTQLAAAQGHVWDPACRQALVPAGPEPSTPKTLTRSQRIEAWLHRHAGVVKPGLIALMAMSFWYAWFRDTHAAHLAWWQNWPLAFLTLSLPTVAGWVVGGERFRRP